MKKNNKDNIYFKATLYNTTDEEVLYNTFGIYIICIMMLLVFAILQDDINIISILLYISAMVVACRVAYKLGINKGNCKHGKSKVYISNKKNTR